MLEEEESEGVKANVDMDPDVPGVIVREGNAVTGRGGLVDGQLVMNADAMVYTWLNVNGVYCDD